MRVFLLTISFVFFYWNSFAQKEKVDQLIQKGIEIRYTSVDSAHNFINQAEQAAKASGLFDEYEAKILIHRAGNNYVAGRYVASMEDYKKAYTLLENTDSQTTDLIRAINGLGLIELAQHNYTAAVRYWEECLTLSYKIQDSLSIIRTHFNLGLGLSELQKFPEAIMQLEKVIKISVEISDNTHGMMATNRLAYIHYQLDDLELALQLYQQVIEQATKSNYWELSFANTGMAEVLIKKEDWQQAISFGEQGYENAKIVGAFWDKQRASAVLTQVYEKTGQYPQALAYAKINKQMGDSLYSREKATEINFLKLQLASSENLKLTQEKTAIQQQNNLYSIITRILVIFLAFLGMGTWMIIRSNKQKSKLNEELAEANQILEEQKGQIELQNSSLNEINQAKNKLFSILSHDLRAPLSSIKQFMELEQQNVFSEEDKEKAKDMLYQQVLQTEHMLNNLLDWSRSQLEGLQTSPSPVAIKEEMSAIINRFDYQIQLKKITVQHKLEDIPNCWVDKNQLRIILQNIFHNAIKFSPFSGAINIGYTLENNQVAVYIQNFGEPISEKKRQQLESIIEPSQSTPGTANETGSGLGLFLVKQFIQANAGSLKVESALESGTTFTIYLPIVSEFIHQSTASEMTA